MLQVPYAVGNAVGNAVGQQVPYAVGLEASLQAFITEARRNNRLSDLPRARAIRDSLAKHDDSLSSVVRDMEQKHKLRAICEQTVWAFDEESVSRVGRGVVKRACHVRTENCSYVVKSFSGAIDVVTRRPHWVEIIMAILAGDLGVGPTVHDAWVCSMSTRAALTSEGATYAWTQLGEAKRRQRDRIFEEATTQKLTESGEIDIGRSERAALEASDVAAMHDKLWTEFPLGISLTLMVMDRIAGRTLTEWMESETPIAGKEIDATLEMLEAKISKLHDEGIVHGDLHTDNIMVTLSPTGATQRVWIVDYGHARIAESRSDSKAMEIDWRRMAESMERVAKRAKSVTSLRVYEAWLKLRKRASTRLRRRHDTAGYLTTLRGATGLRSARPAIILSTLPNDVIQAALVLDDRIVFLSRQRLTGGPLRRALAVVRGPPTA